MIIGVAKTHLYLIRHGETDWNREQRLQGIRDVPLNSAGLAQAHRLGEYFARMPIAFVVSSPLARASATAVIIAKACACPLTTDSRLREIDHGTWSGRTLTDIAECFPSLVKDEQLQPEAFEISGGEPLSTVNRRASEALADLLDTYGGQSVVVVGHGVALGAMRCAATGLEMARLNEGLPPNIGGVILTFVQGQLVDAEPIAIAELSV